MTSRRGTDSHLRSARAATRAEDRRVDRRRAAPPGGGRRLSPGLVILAVAIVLSGVYLVYALTVRDTSQIPMLASGAVVLGIAFGALALYALSAVWRAGVEGRGGQALLLGIVGGGAAIVAAGCVAGAIVLFMLAGSAPPGATT